MVNPAHVIYIWIPENNSYSAETHKTFTLFNGNCVPVCVWVHKYLIAHILIADRSLFLYLAPCRMLVSAASAVFRNSHHRIAEYTPSPPSICWHSDPLRSCDMRHQGRIRRRARSESDGAWRTARTTRCRQTDRRLCFITCENACVDMGKWIR